VGVSVGTAARVGAARTARRTARRTTPVRHGPALPARFYDRDTELVARDLLGAILRCDTPHGVASGRIVETEAYLGEHDAACHAAAGLTPRTSGLYGPPGTAYVYLSYGMHWMMNAVTRAAGLPSAVLIRAVEPLEGIPLMRRRRPLARTDRDLANGPGKLCAALGIGRALHGAVLYRSTLTIHRGAPVGDDEVAVTPRVGITKAVDWPLRWVVLSSAGLSRPCHSTRRGASVR
jgi:DNA-3-methyladenine glycosylase